MTFSPIRSPIRSPMRPGILAGLLGGGATLTPPRVSITEPFTAANSTYLRQLSGWAAYDSTGATITSTATNVYWVQSNQLIKNAGASDFATAPGVALIGRSLGSGETNQRIKVRIVTIAPGGSGRLSLCAASTHSGDLLWLEIITGGAGATLNKRQSGTTTTLATITPSATALGRSIASGDDAEIRVYGQLAWVYISGVLVTAAAGTSLDTGGAFTKGERFGFATRDQGGTYDNLEATTLDGLLTITAPAVFWADDGTGQRNVELAGTYVGTAPTAMRYRLRDATTLAVVQDWAAMTGFSASAGTWAASGVCPLNSNAGTDRYRIEVGAMNDSAASVVSTPFAVGYGIGGWGQSNNQLRDGTIAGAGAPANLNAYYCVRNASVSTWTRNTGSGDQRPGMHIAARLSTLTGVPVGVMMHGVGAQAIDRLTPDTTVTNTDSGETGTPSINNWVQLVNRVNGAKLNGFVRAWIWTHGESGAFISGVTDEAAYKSDFSEILTGLRAWGVTATAPVGITIIGRYNSGGAGGNDPVGGTAIAEWNANATARRRTSYELGEVDALTNVYVGSNFIGCPMTDAYHYTGEGFRLVSERDAQSMAQVVFGVSTYSGRGPLVTAAIRSGATITLTVDLNGAASIAGTGLTNYEVSSDDFATTLTISSAAVSGSDISIVLSADPGSAVKVRSFAGYDWGDSYVAAIGTYADASTIPVEPIYIPITAA